MGEINPIFLAGASGFGFAIAFSLLPGPINLTILNEGAQRGFRWAFLIGLGAAVMDVIYCAISFMGFSSFFNHGVIKASMQVVSVIFLLFLGFKFLLAQSIKVPGKLDAASEKIEATLEQKIHPHSAFMTGFVRVAANLGVLVAWVVLSATLMSNKAFFTDQDWVEDTFNAKAACVTGVLIGTVLWFLILSFGVSRGQGKFGVKTLLRLQHLSGICLIATAVFQGVKFVMDLTQHKI